MRKKMLVAEEEILSDADKEFVALVEELKAKYSLGTDNRIALVYTVGISIGDSYYFVCALSAVQKALNTKFIVLSHSTRLSDFISWHNANGANIEYHPLSNEQVDVLHKGSKKSKEVYVGIFDFFNFTYHDYILANHGTYYPEINNNLTHPKFPDFNAKKYIDEYDIVPGKTVFVIPKSNTHGTLPLYFWIQAIEMLKLFGFHVIVNADKKETIWNTTCFAPPLCDVVHFCNLCGYVFSIQTGLVEFLASEAKAKVYIFTSYYRGITYVYPNIDNSDTHLVEIPLPKKRDDFYMVKPVTDLIFSLTEPLREQIKFRDSLLKLNDDEKPYKLAILSSKSWDPNEGLDANKYFFADRPNNRIADFCTVSYKFFQLNAFLVISFIVQGIDDYETHIAFKKGGQLVKTIEQYNQDTALFEPFETGDYSIMVCLVDKRTRQMCLFETDPFTVKLSVRMKIQELPRYNDYYRYVTSLYYCKAEIIIFVTSRDAHTASDAANRKNSNLDLDIFGIATDLKNKSRHSWLCVIDGGEIVTELTSPDKEVKTEYEWSGNKAEITSAGWNVNKNDKTPVYININGEQKAVNKRGLNFVVWDKTANHLVDSVCFDTFSDFKAYRRGGKE